jgi:hypothetical protein
MTTTTATTDAQRTFGFRVAHAAFRRDVARLEQAVPKIATPDDAAAVLAWFDRVADMLTHHHEIEDDIWWPALTAAGDFADREAAMVDEHARLVAALDSARAALVELAAVAAPERPAARRRAASAATTLARTVEAHLDAEEAAVFGVLAAADEAVVAACEKQSAKRDSLSMLAFALPWALDDAPADLDAEVRASLPGVLRLALGRFDRRYRRRFAGFFAVVAR